MFVHPSHSFHDDPKIIFDVYANTVDEVVSSMLLWKFSPRRSSSDTLRVSSQPSNFDEKLVNNKPFDLSTIDTSNLSKRLRRPRIAVVVGCVIDYRQTFQCNPNTDPILIFLRLLRRLNDWHDSGKNPWNYSMTCSRNRRSMKI
jgi:hypothetical protein